MKHLELGKLLYEFNRAEPPRLWIESGETVLVETEDALSGQIRQPGDRRDKSKMPYSNPVTGPIHIADARPGDSLAIDIVSIVPSLGQCATYTGSPRALCEWLGSDCPHGAHVCPIENDTIHFLPGVDIPYDPMIGCIGTAPDWGSPTTGPAGPRGGNMDIIEVRPGNTLYLPVFVPGALLSLGDAHAAMGHGELSATGLEMPAHITIKVTLQKGKTIPTPRIESPDEIMVVATGSPTERSTAEAYARLILWMEADYGWDRWQAYDLLTHVGRISVGYYGIGTVAVKAPKRYLKR